jgi:hypothetical protein
MENSSQSCKFNSLTLFTQAFLNLDLDSKCLLSLFIKFLGTLLFLLSMTSKIPQIYSTIQKKTNKGLSLVSLYLDLLNCLFQGIFSYNRKFPMYIYGEYFSISIQNGSLILLYWYYENTSAKSRMIYTIRILSSFILFAIVFVCLSNPEKIPGMFFQFLGLSNLPITTISRVSQILLLINSKDAGCLSFASNFMKFLKNFIKAMIILLDVYNPILFLNQVYNGSTVFIIIVLIYVLNKKKSQHEKLKKNE